MGGWSWSPLAEGRELKSASAGDLSIVDRSPLAEGRELKCKEGVVLSLTQVAPRGGA